MYGRAILVIEDEPNLREVMQACLKDLGRWEVLEAASAEEGLIKAAAAPPDAIILDLTMPRMDGFTFLQELRKNLVTQSIPVVVLTAKTYLIDLALFPNAGVVGAGAKPFNPVTLPKQIAAILGWDEEQTDF